MDRTSSNTGNTFTAWADRTIKFSTNIYRIVALACILFGGIVFVLTVIAFFVNPAAGTLLGSFLVLYYSAVGALLG